MLFTFKYLSSIYLCFFFIFASANAREDSDPVIYGPVIVDSCHIGIEINPEEGYFDVREYYKINFKEARHGLFREIPLLFYPPMEFQGKDAEAWAMEPSYLRIKINNIEVPDYDYDIDGGRFSEKLKIRIGDSDVYVKGIRDYTIEYRAYYAFLYSDTATYFYWDVLGTQWDLPFRKVTFNINLPGNPEANIKLNTGYHGSEEKDATFTYSDGIIKGESTAALGNWKGLTLWAELPADYIAPPSPIIKWWRFYGWVIFPPLALLCFFLAWLKWGRDTDLVDAVEYFPPEGMDPALAGYLSDADADTRDIISLIPYWGAKGIISMEVKEDEGFSILNIGCSFVLYTLIFGFTAFSLLILFLEFLYNMSGWAIIAGLCVLIPVSILAIKWFWNFLRIQQSDRDFTLYKLKELPDVAGSYERTVFNELFAGRDHVDRDDLKNSFYRTMSRGKADLVDAAHNMYFTEYSSRNVTITALASFLIGVGGCTLLIYAYGYTAGILFLITCIVLAFCSGLMRKRTVQGDKVLHQVEGFRTFLKKAKKKEIETMLKENPAYFEKALAYAVAFGLLKQYGKKFKGLIKEAPQWYSSPSGQFSAIAFSSSLSNSLNSATHAMTSSPSSSSGGSYGGGGGFSGGGFSGGGFGGGGGGAW